MTYFFVEAMAVGAAMAAATASRVLSVEYLAERFSFRACCVMVDLSFYGWLESLSQSTESKVSGNGSVCSLQWDDDNSSAIRSKVNEIRTQALESWVRGSSVRLCNKLKYKLFLNILLHEVEKTGGFHRVPFNINKRKQRHFYVR
jgi:hypothetical protein